MKRLVILGIIACVGLLFGPAAVIGAGPPGGPDLNFAGFSTAATDGNAGGPLAMHAICQDKFGPNARMCTTEEFWKTPPTETTLEAATIAWIQPVVIATYFDGQAAVGFKQIFVEYSGIRAEAASGQAPTKYFSCGQWGNASLGNSGLTVNSNTGKVTTDGCNITYKVSCCRPAIGR